MKGIYFFGTISLILLISGLACHPKLSATSAPAAVDAKIQISQPASDIAVRFPEGVSEPVYQRRSVQRTHIDKQRVEPPFWWIGMQDTTLEILIYDELIKGYQVAIDYPGVEIKAVHKVESRNYLFIEIDIAAGTKAGAFKIVLNRGDDVRVYDYELKDKPAQNNRSGLDPGDLIYLLMPDRFANGDPSNDSFEDMQQSGVDRYNIFFRHGGDIKGISTHLDYLKDLGVTAIWINPLLENDQAYESYHGYAVTDHYNIDKRFGDNEAYRVLVSACHEKGLKVIMDIIHNHVGDQHWFIHDLPDEDWIHQPDTFIKTSYRATTHMDPYAATADKKRLTDGWFDAHMPDLNQQHPRLARYLTQNNIWWVQYAGIDAFRVDTYVYPDQNFMAEWAQRLQREFPKLSIFGETWVHGASVQAYFTGQTPLRQDFNTHLPAVTDFQLYYGISEALSQRQGWTNGVSRIYYTLAKDFLYQDPFQNIIFLDNHDLSRFYSVIVEDDNKFRSGLAFLMTTRGIPMIYYGTEVLMKGSGGAFGEAGRLDFPGGWPDDSTNKFTSLGRSDKENAAYEFVRKLANFRKNTPVLHRGKLMQFVPENDIYVYFRYDDKQSIMVLMNTSEQPQDVSTGRYAERMHGFSKARDVISDEILTELQQITIAKNSTRILELLR